MKKTAQKYGKQVTRNRELKWVRLGSMRVSPQAQRELKQARVDHLVSVFDPDQLGNPEVSYRDGHYYIMDGQHRVAAVKEWFGKGWEDQHIQCWVASGLSEQEEAEGFLLLNDKLNVDIFQKFRVAVNAGRQIESDIDGIVRAEGLCVSQQQLPGAVGAVGTLKRVYGRDGKECLRRALCIARDAYGDSGLVAAVLDGLGLLCGRYNGALDEASAIAALKKALGGVNGLLGRAETLRQKTGNAKGPCVAAAAVEIINRDRKAAQRLADWWRS
jgi:hypothetical protein